MKAFLHKYYFFIVFSTISLIASADFLTNPYRYYVAPAGGDPTIEATTVADSNGDYATTLDCPAPATIVIGEFLQIVVMSDSNNIIPDPYDVPSGWTKRDYQYSSLAGASYAIISKTAVSGDIGTTVTVTMTGSGGEMICFYSRISGVDTAAPYHVIGAGDQYLASNAPHYITIVGETSTIDNVLFMYALAYDGGDGVPFSVFSGTDWYEEAEGNSGTADNSDTSGTIGYKFLASQGASGNVTLEMAAKDSARASIWGLKPE